MTMSFSTALQLALILASVPALALAGEVFPDMPGTKIAAATNPIPGRGVVLKVDRDNAMVKINHDPIPALDWPRMTMPFHLKERALADQVKEGDTVEFFLEKSGSDYIIVKFGKTISTKASP